jgi:hypothetical protein
MRGVAPHGMLNALQNFEREFVALGGEFDGKLAEAAFYGRAHLSCNFGQKGNLRANRLLPSPYGWKALRAKGNLQSQSGFGTGLET